MNQRHPPTTGDERGVEVSRRSVLRQRGPRPRDAAENGRTSRRTVLGTLAAAVGASVTVGSAGADSDGSVDVPDVEGPVTGGVRTGEPKSASLPDPGEWGYVEEEYFLSGSATNLSGTAADYATRILVYRPEDPAAFNGTAVLNWANVAFDLDVPTLWVDTYDHLMREGYVCVALSAQQAGVDDMKQWDPERYGPLHHPGDSYSYDVFSQAAKLLQVDDRPSPDPLDGLATDVVLAGGQVSDGRREGYLDDYLVANDHVDVVDGYLFPTCGRVDNQAAPVLWINSESEAERGPWLRDDGPFRVWEVAGAAHINWWKLAYGLRMSTRDRSGVGGTTTAPVGWDETAAGQYGERRSGACPQNFFPMRYAMRAGLEQLDHWVRTGEKADGGLRYERDRKANLVTDEHGNVAGGLRLPVVEVPVATYDGRSECDGNAVGGSTTRFDPVTLRELYPTRRDYVDQLRAAADAAVAAGVLRPADAEDLVARAENANVPHPAAGRAP